ncbi:hypothetical protein B296_00030998 [Ensete ventricosum]|uniref:Mediator of RNA polymerase II transcription subunit 33A n=1 Tax=Ensete ventricosum TaxID=4639 RepID=A0A426YBL0_ENSVE|nr:hypothetical protein B296_00030998 [Ensete ventricosum]
MLIIWSVRLFWIAKSIDAALQLSCTYGVQQMDFGHAIVLFILNIITSLMDCTIEDCGPQLVSVDKHGCAYASGGEQTMQVNVKENSDEQRNEHHEQLRRTNALMAIEVAEKVSSNKKAKAFLHLIRINISLSISMRAMVVIAHPIDSFKHHGAGIGACWIPVDIFMENAMDGKHLYAISAVEILTELTKTLQVINQASWQETFQTLWVSALRLVQRDREPIEGPIPHLDARLCMLLSIVPLAVAAVVKEENETPYPFSNGFLRTTKAAVFVYNFKAGNSNLNDCSIKAVGNMLHLIVEACIARNLIDTSAYFWPGYVVPSVSSKDPTSFQDSSWSTFLEGAPLTDSLKNSLMVTPASSLVEVEKVYHIAVNGSEEEKLAAAKILCGASLVCGWNVQEHVVFFVVKLLSLPMPPDSSASAAENYLIGHMPVLSAILFGVSCVDIVHILSLHGMIPEVAAALMPLCEVFGSLSPLSSHKLRASEETSVYSVFSCAFLFLLRLWKFYKPPQELCKAGRGSIKMELTLDYLLLMRNIYIDSFPKLRAWYFQNQACIASILSGLCNRDPVHQTANKILNMMYRKMSKNGPVSGNPSSNSSSSISGSPVSITEDTLERPMLPAWEILGAIPFVLEAVLTACAHGRLSSRDLTTGLRDLVDFLPASVATIVSYFSAEITRGIWKPVPMNGTDWPSPAPTLLSIESEVKEILASAGVHINSCYPRMCFILYSMILLYMVFACSTLIMSYFLLLYFN